MRLIVGAAGFRIELRQGLARVGVEPHMLPPAEDETDGARGRPVLGSNAGAICGTPCTGMAECSSIIGAGGCRSAFAFWCITSATMPTPMTTSAATTLIMMIHVESHVELSAAVPGQHV